MNASTELRNSVRRLLMARIISREEAERILRPEDLSEAEEDA